MKVAVASSRDEHTIFNANYKDWAGYLWYQIRENLLFVDPDLILESESR